MFHNREMEEEEKHVYQPQCPREDDQNAIIYLSMARTLVYGFLLVLGNPMEPENRSR